MGLGEKSRILEGTGVDEGSLQVRNDLLHGDSLDDPLDREGRGSFEVAYDHGLAVAAYVGNAEVSGGEALADCSCGQVRMALAEDVLVDSHAVGN